MFYSVFCKLIRGLKGMIYLKNIAEWVSEKREQLKDYPAGEEGRIFVGRSIMLGGAAILLYKNREALMDLYKRARQTIESFPTSPLRNDLKELAVQLRPSLLSVLINAAPYFWTGGQIISLKTRELLGASPAFKNLEVICSYFLGFGKAVNKDYTYSPASLYVGFGKIAGLAAFAMFSRKLLEFSKPSHNENQNQIDSNSFFTDLTAQAKAGTLRDVIARDAEINEVIEVLLKKDQPHPLLLGEAGSGKTAIVEGLAARISKGEVPDKLRGLKVLSLDLARLMEGTMYMGTLEGRLSGIMQKIQSSPNVILFCDEIHRLKGSGVSMGNPTGGIFDSLKPYLSDNKSQLRLIGATTLREFEQHIKTDDAIVRRFGRVNVNPPTKEQSLVILKSVAKSQYGPWHKCSYANCAIQKAYELSNGNLAKALELLDRAGSHVNAKDPYLRGVYANLIIEQYKKITEQPKNMAE